MSVIQSIREKYAKWAVVAIALALLGFILTDYFTAKNRMSGGSSTTIGTINGKKIDYVDYETKLKTLNAQTQQQYSQMSREFTETDQYQNNERLWNQEVDEVVMNEEFQKLGIDVGKKEFTDWIYGQDAPQYLKQQFSDQQGNYDPATAQNQINQIKRSNNQTQKDQLNLYLASIEYSRKYEKYNSLVSNSIYYPKWFVEKQNAESAAMAKVSFVKHSYASISDSSIKITDKEIEDYVSKHKDLYKQEESRSIDYVVFDAAPTVSDSAAARKQMIDLKEDFAKATDPAVFLSRYGSVLDYSPNYYSKTEIQVPAKDSIFALAKDQIYGPYLDGHSYVLAKMIDIKQMPDSVKARHILIPTNNPQTGQQLLDDSTAKKRIDSIATAIKGGARFDSLAAKYSSDQSSATKGGVVANPNNPATNYFTGNTMVKEFNDFCFEGKTGDKKVVKTAFGYHYIEILDQKNMEPHYKVAYFAKNILASDETEQAALEAASKFASESQDIKSFEDNIAKSKGSLRKLSATNIRPTDAVIQGISVFGPSRSLVRDIYKADKGEVLKQSQVGDTKNGYKYIVAVVSDVLKEGTQPAYVARPAVERILKDQKKGEQIKQMVGKVTTLEAAAAILKDSVVTTDSLRIAGNDKIRDAKVLGAIFNNANKGKVISEPILGNDAAYIIRVDDLTTTSVPNVNTIAAQQAQLRAQRISMQSQPFGNNMGDPATVLRKQAAIKDNRRNIY